MAVFLVIVHWIPDIAAWMHANFYGEVLVIDARRYRVVLVVAYVMVGVAVVVDLAGQLWAAWHSRRGPDR
jgi:hypothetical protein